MWFTALGIAAVAVCAAWVSVQKVRGIPNDDDPGEGIPPGCTGNGAGLPDGSKARVPAKDGVTPVEEGLFVGDALEGTFLQLSAEHCTWSVTRWKEEFASLRRIGLRSVIVQWVKYGDTDFTLAARGDTSPMARIAAAADASQLDLYVGLSLNPSWWNTTKLTRDTVARELANSTSAADRVHPMLTSHASFRGWYIPQEVTDLYYTAEQETWILGFFQQLSAHLRRLEPLKPVMAAGYTNHDESKRLIFVTWWAKFLNEAGVDILVFQDGAGIPRQSPWRNALPLIEALADRDENFRGDIWLLAEVFSQTSGQPINDRPFRAVPAGFDRVREQLMALGRFKKRLIAYSYFDYMRPSAGESAAGLYEAYRRYVEEKAAGAVRPPVKETGAPAARAPGTR